ncbi:hypothetical protein NBRC116590_13690 [Pelagimonas sp. KU-00592-HH]
MVAAFAMRRALAYAGRPSGKGRKTVAKPLKPLVACCLLLGVSLSAAHAQSLADDTVFPSTTPPFSDFGLTYDPETLTPYPLIRDCPECPPPAFSGRIPDRFTDLSFSSPVSRHPDGILTFRGGLQKDGSISLGLIWTNRRWYWAEKRQPSQPLTPSHAFRPTVPLGQGGTWSSNCNPLTDPDCTRF